MIFLHIGLGKCGSSTIQRFASANRAALRDAGVIYPALGFGDRDFEHHKLLGDVVEGDVSTVDAVEAVEEVRRSLEANPDANFLLSSEFFLKNDAGKSAHTALALRDFVGRHPVRVLVYIREYPSWVESLYAQKTKRGENHQDIDGFVQGRGMVHSVSMVAGLRPWIEVFGAQNIRVRSLDRANLVGGDLIADLLDAIGVKAAMPAFRRINEAPPWAFLELARNIAARIPETGPETQNMLRAWFKNLAFRTTAALERANVALARPQYLGQSDWLIFSTLYNWDVTRINQMLPDHALPLMQGTMVEERGAAPSVMTIPEEVWAVYFNALTRRLLLRRMPETLRVALRSVVRARRRKIRGEGDPGDQSSARPRESDAERADRRLRRLAERAEEKAAQRAELKAAKRVAERAARREEEKTARRAAERTARREAEKAARRVVERVARREEEKAARRAAERAARREQEKAPRQAAEQTAQSLAQNNGWLAQTPASIRAGESSGVRWGVASAATREQTKASARADMRRQLRLTARARKKDAGLAQ